MKVNDALFSGLEAASRIVGNTPVMPLDGERIQLYAKLEFYNPSGSVKDRPALRVLKSAMERGEVTGDTTVIESSSGNFATALATLCKKLRIKFIPVIDPNILPGIERLLCMSCHRVEKVVERDDTGGFLKTRLEKVKALCSEMDSFWPNQYGNPECMVAHYETTGAEICGQLPDLDYLFIGVSSGGTLAGVSKRIKEERPNVKIIAVDIEGSVIFGGKPKKRFIPGIGASIRPDLLDLSEIDDLVMVSDLETVTGCLELFNRHGIFAGGSSGAVYFAVQRYFERNPRRGPVSAAFLCPDRGTPYLDTVYNPVWVDWLKDQ